MKGSLTVLDGGMLTTVQDRGRYGFRKFGVPISGVMDDHSYRLANWLVGNIEATPVLEMTLKGGGFLFKTDAVVGLSGGEADIYINSEPQDMNKTLMIHPGDQLAVGRIKKGCRIYMAIQGKWNVEDVLGSSSTYSQAGFGGIKGRALRKADNIFWDNDQSGSEIKKVPQKLIPHFSSKQKIRIIEGPEWDWLPEDEKAHFLNMEFGISSKSNRMGIRLESDFSFKTEEREMKSAPVVPGIIQLAKGGSPIILMKDGQSIGGYPRIAKVTDADLWRLGQVWTSSRLSFKTVSIEEAKKLSAFHKDSL